MSISSLFSAKKLRSLHESFEPMLRSMRGGANAVMPGGTNTSIGMQLVETFVIVVVFSLTMQILESNFLQLQRYQQMSVDVYPKTYNSSHVFKQDPSTASCFPILEPSKDERNGAEYSYSSFIRVSSDNFTGEKNVLRHVFHKGSPSVYPLMAPGVFFMADTNVLRVYQNSTLNWNRYVDVNNIPLNKWFHLVVMLKGNALDIYINGNLANRYKFTDVPKLNYGNFYLLNGSTSATFNPNANVSCTATQSVDSDGNIVNTVSSTVEDPTQADNGIKTGTSSLQIVGAMKGYVSRVKYFAFALSYTQIDKLLREGPNKEIQRSKKEIAESPAATIALPFYQTDDWWTTDRHSGLGPQ